MDVAVGSATKRVSLYMLDWDNAGRSQRVDVLDAVSGVVLHPDGVELPRWHVVELRT